MFESFFKKASIWVEAFVNVIVDIINRVISFFADVIDWFKKKLHGVRQKVAYIIKAIKLMDVLKEDPALKGLLKSGKAKVITDTGIYENSVAEIVYDKQTDKITDLRFVGSHEGMDDRLKDVLDSGELVQLS